MNINYCIINSRIYYSLAFLDQRILNSSCRSSAYSYYCNTYVTIYMSFKKYRNPNNYISRIKYIVYELSNNSSGFHLKLLNNGYSISNFSSLEIRYYFLNIWKSFRIYWLYTSDLFSFQRENKKILFNPICFRTVIPIYVIGPQYCRFDAQQPNYKNYLFFLAFITAVAGCNLFFSSFYGIFPVVVKNTLSYICTILI